MIRRPPRSTRTVPLCPYTTLFRSAVATGFADSPSLTFNLAEADLTTALRVADAINQTFGDNRAHAMDAVSIRIDAETGAEKRIMIMGLIENITVKPAEAPARVIVNARTGTVVINGAVRITSAAVTHGKLTVRVDEQPRVVQPRSEEHTSELQSL